MFRIRTNWFLSIVAQLQTVLHDHSNYRDIHIATQSVIGGWGGVGAKASEQVDQSDDLNPISAIDSTIDLAEAFAKDLTIDLPKDVTKGLAKIL